MAKTSDRIDDGVGVVKNRRWNSLLQLTTILSQLEELAASPIESPSLLVAALDRGFLKKRKRSPRNVKSRFKKPQSTNSALCTNQFQEQKRRRLVIYFKKRAPVRSPNLLAALDRGFLKKRKRSPRNVKSRFKKPQSALCTNQFQEKKRCRAPMRTPNLLAALDRGFLKKRKRSPRNHNNFLAKAPRTDHQEPIFKKPPMGDGQTPETSSGGEQRSLCMNPNFENRKRKRGLELEEEISSKRRQLMVGGHILDNLQAAMMIFETGGRVPTAVGSAQCCSSRLLQVRRERFLFPAPLLGRV